MTSKNVDAICEQNLYVTRSFREVSPQWAKVLWLPGSSVSDPIIGLWIDTKLNFHIDDSTGTGTAPFRSFWQELDEIKMMSASFSVPKVWLFFGCRAKCLDLYSAEKREMLEKGILDKVFLALSREANIPKVS